jgi:hypothetical protein
MIFVTCRPYPCISDGIGAFSGLIDFIVQVALVTNGLLVITALRAPWEYWSMPYKFCVFSAWVIGGTFVSLIARTMSPEVSPEAERGQDINNLFKGSMAGHKSVTLQVLKSQSRRFDGSAGAAA